MTHTPRPWRVDRLKDINDEIVVRAGNAVDFICMVVGRDKEQNARLIAAAPDMLKALTFIANGRDATVKSFAERAVKLARAAIAKAEGRTQSLTQPQAAPET